MSEVPAPSPWVRLALHGSALVTALLIVLLGWSGALPWPDAATVSVLLALLPLVAVIQVPLAADAEVRRIPAYTGSIATIALVGLGSLAVGARRGGVSAVGLVSLPAEAWSAWSLALAAAGLAIIGGARILSLRWGIAESPLLRALLPRTPRERWMFGGVSLAAGLGEELAYRGYAIPVLAAVTGGVWTAAILTSLAFGVLHAYQGPLGIVRTALMGLVLAAGYLLSGSLWPVVTAHFVIDLIAGLVLADRLTAPPGCGAMWVRVRCCRVLLLSRRR